MTQRDGDGRGAGKTLRAVGSALVVLSVLGTIAAMVMARSTPFVRPECMAGVSSTSCLLALGMGLLSVGAQFARGKQENRAGIALIGIGAGLLVLPGTLFFVGLAGGVFRSRATPLVPLCSTQVLGFVLTLFGTLLARAKKT